MDAPRQEFRHDGEIDSNVLTQVRAIFQDALRHIQDSREYLTATFSCAFPATGVNGEARYGSVSFVIGYGDARAFTRGGDSWTSTGLAAADSLDVRSDVAHESGHGAERGGRKNDGARSDSSDRKRRKDDVEGSNGSDSSDGDDDDEPRARKRVKVSMVGAAPSRRAKHRAAAGSPSPYRRAQGALQSEDHSPPLLHPKPRVPPHEDKLLSSSGWNPPKDQPAQPRLRTPPPAPALRTPTPPGQLRDRHGVLIPIQSRSSWNERPVFNRADGTALNINHWPIRSVERPSASPENLGGDIEIESYHSSPEWTDSAGVRNRSREGDRSHKDEDQDGPDESASSSDHLRKSGEVDHSSLSSEGSSGPNEVDDHGPPSLTSSHGPIEEKRFEVFELLANGPSASDEARSKPDPARWDDAMNTAATLYEAELLRNVVIDECEANESYVPGNETLAGSQEEDEGEELDDSKAEEEEEEPGTANISGSDDKEGVEEDTAAHDEIEKQLGVTEASGNRLPLTDVTAANVTSTNATTALAANGADTDTSIRYADETYCCDPEAAAALLALGDVTPGRDPIPQSSTNPKTPETSDPANASLDPRGEWDDALTLQLLAELEAAIAPSPPPLRPGPVNRILNPPSGPHVPSRGRGIGPSPLQASYVPSPSPLWAPASPSDGHASFSSGASLSPRVLRAPTPGGPSTPSPASCPPSLSATPLGPTTPLRTVDSPPVFKAPTPGGPSTPSLDASAIAALVSEGIAVGRMEFKSPTGFFETAPNQSNSLATHFDLFEGDLSPDGASTPIGLASKRIRPPRAPATPTPISRLNTDAFSTLQKRECGEVRRSPAPIGRLSSPPPREGESTRRVAVREAREAYSFHPYSRPASNGSAESSKERRKQGNGTGNAGETSSELEDDEVERAARREVTEATGSPSHPAAAPPVSKVASPEPESEASPGRVQTRCLTQAASAAAQTAGPPPLAQPSWPAKRAKRETVKKEKKELVLGPELESGGEVARRYPRRNTRRPPPR